MLRHEQRLFYIRHIVSRTIYGLISAETLDEVSAYAARFGNLADLEFTSSVIFLALDFTRDDASNGQRRWADDGCHKFLVNAHWRPFPSSKIYFVGDARMVKIGITSNVQDRVRKLQTGNSRQLKILRLVSGDVDEEIFFHERFADLRGIGEWFRNEGPLKHFLANVRL